MPRSVCALSHHPETAVAVGEVIGAVLEQVDPHPDLAVLLLSGRNVEQAPSIVASVQALVAPEVLIGTGASAIFDPMYEATVAPAVALLVVHETEVQPLRLSLNDSGDFDGWPTAVEPESVALILAGPRFPGRALLGHVASRSPSVGLVGATRLGLDGSAGAPPLLFDDWGLDDGAVGVLFAPGQATAHELVVPRLEAHELVVPRLEAHELVVPRLEAHELVALPHIDGEVRPGSAVMVFSDAGVDLAAGPRMWFEAGADDSSEAAIGVVANALLSDESPGGSSARKRSTVLVIG